MDGSNTYVVVSHDKEYSQAILRESNNRQQQQSETEAKTTI